MKETFFQTRLRFTKTEYTKRTCIRERPFKFTGSDAIHLKRDFIYGSNVNGIRQPILYSFAFDKPPDHKIFKRPRSELYKEEIGPILIKI